MEEEDWGATASNRPVFTLFKQANPEDEAKKNSAVDIVTYTRWSRAERRLYQRLKLQNVVAMIEQDKCSSVDDIANCLDQLTIIRREDETEAEDLDNIISKLEDMKLKATTAIEQKKKKKVLQIKGS